MPEPFTLRSLAVGAGAKVVRFSGREAVNELYDFDIRLLIHRQEVSSFLNRALGERGLLTMQVDGDRGRLVHGILTEADVIERYDDTHVIATVSLAPKLARLALRRTSRVFLGQSVREIVADVLDRDGIRHRFSLRSNCPRREMCVQYAESDHDFISRLLAEEGLFTFFEHPTTGEEEVLVIGDEPSAYGALSGGSELRYRGGEPEGGMAAAEDTVRSFVASRRLRPRAVLQRSHDFAKPQLELGRGQAVEGVPRLERRETMRALVDRELTVAEHFGPREEGLIQPHDGRRSLEAERRGSSEAVGVTSSRRLLPGSIFKLTEHDVPDLEGAYVITEARHEGFGAEFRDGDAALYTNTFRCEPADVAVRPSRPRPRVVQALETATVVGPPGQDVFTDAFGRIKLKFHWDLDDAFDDKRSCWARVGQAWAGAGWGAQFIPRVGMEVLVGFMGGDPDRPVVLGGVYNGTNPIPFGNDLAGGVSGIRSRGLADGSGGHEIMWDDRPGAESLTLRADGLMVAEANEDMRLSSGGATLIRTSASRTDEIGDALVMTVGGATHRTVAKEETAIVGGDQRVRVGGLRQDEVTGDCTSIVGDSLLQRIGGRRTTFVGAGSTREVSDSLAVNGHYYVSASGGIALRGNETLDLRVGSSSIRIEPHRILIEADEIVIQGRDRVSAAQGKEQAAASLVLQGSASLSGGEVFASSGAGAKLHLDADAHLDGALVKLNCGSGSGAGAKLVQDTAESGTAVVRLDPRFLEGSGPYVLVMQMPDGSIAEFPIEPGGEVVLPGKPGDQFLIVDVRQGEKPIAVRREDQ